MIKKTLTRRTHIELDMKSVCRAIADYIKESEGELVSADQIKFDISSDDDDRVLVTGVHVDIVEEVEEREK